jgi:predicted RNase H-like HicB family nuclease
MGHSDGAPVATPADTPLTLAIEYDREDDGRWIADIPALPGVLVYGTTRDEAEQRVKALALHVLADKLEHGEIDASAVAPLFVGAAA